MSFTLTAKLNEFFENCHEKHLINHEDGGTSGLCVWYCNKDIPREVFCTWFNYYIREMRYVFMTIYSVSWHAFFPFLEISSTRRLIPKRNRNATTMTDCCWRTTKVATNNSSLRYLLRLPLTWTLTVMHIRSVSDLFCTFLRQTYVSEQCSTHSNLDVFISPKFFSHNLLCSLKVKQQSSEYHVFVSIRDAT